MEKEFEIFKNGSTWLRADFHLHTDADNEFNYDGDSEFYISNYVNQLSRENISIAAITNHNKFDSDEFKALSKAAKKKEIYLLPGVELSVNDGANGIHCLVIFNPVEWLENNTDYINQFLSITFAGKHNYENENGRSNDSLIETINKLDAFEKDYFIILAHIEANSGFYKELNGGRITELGKQPIFRKAVLGIQKVRTRDVIKKLNQWLDNELPALVEGSDAKNIEGIGTGNAVNGITQKTYLKIGAFNFEAVKYALIDKQYRQTQETTIPANGYIKSISFDGKKLNSTINLNHSMNNLIGIRGSGKSSILETIRYALDIDLTERQNIDYDYKTKLVNALLGSGGKITSVLVDDQGKEYVAEKILGDRTNIYKDGELQLGLKPNAIVKKPIYFGQKDLSQIGDSLSTEYLISKLIGDRLQNKKREVEEKKQDVLRILSELKKIDSKVARKADIEAKQAELKIKIQVFRDNEIDKKLEKQISFDKDSNFIKRLEKFELKVIEGLNEYVGEYEDSFQSFKAYSSKENGLDIDKIKQHLTDFEGIFLETKTISSRLVTENLALGTMHKKFNVKYDELKEEFSEIKRKIDLPNIQADDYVKYTKELDLTKAQLSELEKLSQKKKELETQLKQTLVTLQNLWHNEFEIVQEEIKKVNDDQDSIKIAVEFKGNKEDFKSYLKENLRGSNLRDINIQAIIANYNDMIAVYEDLSKPNSIISSNLSDVQLNTFRDYFNSNTEAFLTFRVPDKFDIIYRGRLLKDHSLGQRASALIIFLLTLKESDLIIIDQPEDDLDNQTIYNDVIKVLKELKNTSQFIFATHNPNIPVLGDCEQVVSCRYDSNIIETNLGSIDDESIRKEIVNIMEGGKEAFNNRKRIYELWTH
ncbi:MAG: AAA family ATPase [Salinivirgaceae bacterium]